MEPITSEVVELTFEELDQVGGGHSQIDPVA